jgi:hypothetical protein
LGFAGMPLKTVAPLLFHMAFAAQAIDNIAAAAD